MLTQVPKARHLGRPAKAPCSIEQGAFAGRPRCLAFGTWVSMHSTPEVFLFPVPYSLPLSPVFMLRQHIQFRAGQQKRAHAKVVA